MHAHGAPYCFTPQQTQIRPCSAASLLVLRPCHRSSHRSSCCVPRPTTHTHPHPHHHHRPRQAAAHIPCPLTAEAPLRNTPRPECSAQPPCCRSLIRRLTADSQKPHSSQSVVVICTCHAGGKWGLLVLWLLHCRAWGRLQGAVISRAISYAIRSRFVLCPHGLAGDMKIVLTAWTCLYVVRRVPVSGIDGLAELL